MTPSELLDCTDRLLQNIETTVPTADGQPYDDTPDLRAVCGYLRGIVRRDDGEAWTEEWVISLKPPQYWHAGREYSWPGTGLRFAEKVGNRRSRIFQSMFYLDLQQGMFYLTHVKTRGDVRDLFRSLGITLNEKETDHA